MRLLKPLIFFCAEANSVISSNDKKDTEVRNAAIHPTPSSIAAPLDEPSNTSPVSPRSAMYNAKMSAIMEDEAGQQDDTTEDSTPALPKPPAKMSALVSGCNLVAPLPSDHKIMMVWLDWI